MGTLLLLAAGVHMGRGVAFLLCGAGWVAPAVADLFTSVPGVVAGDPAAGLDPVPNLAPVRWVLTVSVAVAELAMIVLAVAAGRFAWTRWGPGRLPGSASPVEVAPLLGVRRLRRSAPVVRPDLYGPGRR